MKHQFLIFSFMFGSSLVRVETEAFSRRLHLAEDFRSFRRRAKLSKGRRIHWANERPSYFDAFLQLFKHNERSGMSHEKAVNRQSKNSDQLNLILLCKVGISPLHDNSSCQKVFSSNNSYSFFKYHFFFYNGFIFAYLVSLKPKLKECCRFESHVANHTCIYEKFQYFCFARQLVNIYEKLCVRQRRLSHLPTARLLFFS